jgi:hypothetical protein
MSKKLTFEEVKQAFEERGYELLENKYVNARTPMKYICNKHIDKINKISCSNLKQGSGCPHCGNENQTIHIRTPFENIKSTFEERGYVLLETQENYKDVDQKLRYICPHHPDKQNSICYASLRRGCGCPHCAGQGKPTLEEMKQKFKLRGYELIATEYKNAHVSMDFICPHHPDKQNSISYRSFKRGCGCPYCSGMIEHTYDEVKLEFEKRGYKLISTTYKNANINLKYICPHHPSNPNSICYSNLRKGAGCNYCAIEKRMGSGSPNWKGGMTKLDACLRNNSKYWKKNILKKYNFTCFLSNKKQVNIQVHHLKPLHIIRDEVIISLNLPLPEEVDVYTEEEQKKIKKGFSILHKKSLGIPLCEEIHNLFHKLYSKKCTPEDFDEFRQRWDNGEFTHLNI